MTSSKRELTGTIAIVTGASSGIGEATAHALAQKGAAVCLAARRAERLDEVQEAITNAGGTALGFAIDLTSPNAPQALVARCVDHFGRVDLCRRIAAWTLLICPSTT